MAILTASDIRDRMRESYKAFADEASVPRILCVLSEADRMAAGSVKKWCVDNKVLATLLFGYKSVSELKAIAEKYKYDFVVVSSSVTFKELGGFSKKGNQAAWRGSVLPTWVTGFPCPVLITMPLLDAKGRPREHTVPTAKWVFESDLAKVKSYTAPYEYRFTIISCDAERAQLIAASNEAAIIAVDIETNLANYIISIAFTMVSIELEVKHTYVVSMVNMDTLARNYVAVKHVLEQTDSIKCFHNGCFDMTLLMRHRLGIRNYLLDTEYLWHAYEAESEKSLAFVASMLLPDYTYWKHESKEALLEYNAKDTINTARCMIWMLRNLPDWAWKNYAQMVPLFCPTVVCNLEGFAVDHAKLAEAKEAAEAIKKRMEAEVVQILGVPKLKLGSPTQLSHILYKVYGPVFGWSKPTTAAAKKRVTATGKDTTGTDITSLKVWALEHPLAGRIAKALLDWRAVAKSISTYYNAALYGDSGRLYYNFRIDGTSTGRYSCSASALRYIRKLGKKGQVIAGGVKQYGTQIQNAPAYYKAALMADPGYLIFNIDKSKSEAHCVGLLSGDKRFIQAINDLSRDFYLLLASWFFGISTDDKKHPIRQVTKKINHATSYCMGWATFLDQVGIVAIRQYMKLTNWQGGTDPQKFINHLLEGCFHFTFPGIKRMWSRTTKTLIETGGYLTTPDGAVRHFFRYPSTPRGISPPAVAHQPQRLSVVTLNRNMAQVFYKIQLPYQFALRLKGQVHDSLVGQVKLGYEWLVDEVKAIMEIPYQTSLGVLAIPCDVDPLSTHWKMPTQALTVEVVAELEPDYSANAE